MTFKLGLNTDEKEPKPTWIDVWYDRSQRLWAAQLKDDEGYLIGNAEWGTKGDINLIASEWIRDYSLNEEHIKKMKKTGIEVFR